MIDNHIIHYSLCNILYLLFDFISFLGYHIVSINRTRPISNKTHIQTEVAPYSLILYSSSPLSLLLPLFYNSNLTFQIKPSVIIGSFCIPLCSYFRTLKLYSLDLEILCAIMVMISLIYIWNCDYDGL